MLNFLKRPIGQVMQEIPPHRYIRATSGRWSLILYKHFGAAWFTVETKTRKVPLSKWSYTKPMTATERVPSHVQTMINDYFKH